MFLQPESEIWKAVDRVALGEGLCVYDIELTRGGMRVFVERQTETDLTDKDGAGERVTSGDCTRLCRRLMVHCSVEGPQLGLSEESEIEVSSPGINRELRLAEHFRLVQGQRIRVIGTQGSAFAEAHRDPLIGQLTEVAADQLMVVEEGTEKLFVIPLAEVKRAHVDYKF